MKPEDIFTKLSARRDECRLILERAKQKSEGRLNLLRKTAADMMGDKQVLIGGCRKTRLRRAWQVDHISYTSE